MKVQIKKYSNQHPGVCLIFPTNVTLEMKAIMHKYANFTKSFLLAYSLYDQLLK